MRTPQLYWFTPLLILTLSACGVGANVPAGEVSMTPVAQATSVVTPTATMPAEQPTSGTQPTPVPTVVANPTEQAAPSSVSNMPSQPAALFYFWPTTLPPGLVVNEQTSTATDAGFVLELNDPSNAQNSVTITSDPGLAEGATRGEPITGRGQPGRTFSTGAGANITWLEGEQWVRVSGMLLSTEQAIALAESLEALDRTTWLDRLQAGG